MDFVRGFPGSSDDKPCNVGDGVLSLGCEDSLKEEMAIHSSTLAWEISWKEEPGRLSPWGHKKSDMTE